VHDEVPGQAGNNHPTSIPTGVFPTTDGHINIAAAGNTIWHRLCDAMGKPEWKEDERFLDNADRLKHRDMLNDMIAEISKTKSSKEWIDLFAKAGVPSGHIYNVGDMFADEQVKHLGIATDIETTAFGKTQLIGQPIKMSRTPSELKVSPPERGEHSDEILGDIGLSAEEIADLRSRNVV
jgi:formyl-CoA transferase